ncbi:MurR/RpiR family transcriptional regulator [Candidatus Enterococcus murrayae]|uniref:MurR/RpiR family transcriptional regulator n=1 Tax=Candidatus Enterococcus murrayae TaxID=2815321 RepID=A0ABS3HGW6_9ENTE|nr:MurR/RpiR family transcriptional regulator [Enterococcus sp. MJM16]MBO0452267.1 MurR/RpiR family transcriptional regulator [Enterococcus sp. MJM16]
MIIQQLQEGTNFTHQEKAIVLFILENRESILDKTAKEIAAITLTSPATINRLCKKLGFTSYHEFQLQYVSEYAQSIKNDQTKLDVTASNIDLSKTVEGLYQETVRHTQAMLKKASLNRVINRLIHSKRIDFYASDMNYTRAQGICLKLSSLGINTQVFNTYNDFYIATLSDDDSVAVIISHSGKNSVMINAAMELRRKNIYTIALTSNVNRELDLLCNESLYIYSGNYELTSLQYGVSVDYLLDVIFTCLVARKRKDPF